MNVIALCRVMGGYGKKRFIFLVINHKSIQDASLKTSKRTYF